jgi:fused signal recognition particle receptor
MGIIDILKNGLKKTRAGFVNRVEDLILGKKQIDKEVFDRLEEIMISADIGVKTTALLLRDIEEKVQRKELNDPSRLTAYLKNEIKAIFSKGGMGESEEGGIRGDYNSRADRGPFVILVIGVNGAGKTTTIGKLAYKYKNEGKKVLLAAGDTFRAAAIEQLEVWGKRVGFDVIRQNPGADPSAVVFDA